MNYTTLAKLQAYLNITDTNDAKREGIITTLSSILSTELGDDLSEKTQTRRYDGYDTYRVVMESIVNTVTKIEYTRDNGYSRTEATLDYIDGYMVYSQDKLPKGTKNVRITYTKGYATVPADLEAFFLQYVATYVKSLPENENNKEIKNKRLDGLSITYF